MAGRTIQLAAIAVMLSLWPAQAQASDPPPHMTQIALTSELTPAALIGMTGGTDLSAHCPTAQTQASLPALFVAFFANLFFSEALEAEGRRIDARIRSLTDSYSGLRNSNGSDFVLAPAAPAAEPDNRQLIRFASCVVVGQEDRSTDDGEQRSLFVMGLQPAGATAASLHPLFARVSATSANALFNRPREAGRRSVNAQVALSFTAWTGGQCAAGATNCQPARRRELGTPELSFGNLVPGEALFCAPGAGNRTSAACMRTSGETPLFALPPAGTPLSIGAAVQLTSTQLQNAEAQRAMWQRQRGGLLELLNGIAGSALD